MAMTVGHASAAVRCAPVVAKARGARVSTSFSSRMPQPRPILRMTPRGNDRAARLVVRAEETVGERVMNAAGSPEEEAAGLASMRAALEAKGDCPPCDDQTALWFLRDRKMDAEAAAEKLEDFLVLLEDYLLELGLHLAERFRRFWTRILVHMAALHCRSRRRCQISASRRAPDAVPAADRSRTLAHPRSCHRWTHH